MTNHLVGVQEIADLLGITRQAVYLAMEGPGFPQPVVELKSGRVWERAAIEEWSRGRRKRGRPRKATKQ